MLIRQPTVAYQQQYTLIAVTIRHQLPLHPTTSARHYLIITLPPTILILLQLPILSLQPTASAIKVTISLALHLLMLQMYMLTKVTFTSDGVVP